MKEKKYYWKVLDKELDFNGISKKLKLVHAKDLPKLEDDYYDEEYGFASTLNARISKAKEVDLALLINNEKYDPSYNSYEIDMLTKTKIQLLKSKKYNEFLFLNMSKPSRGLLIYYKKEMVKFTISLEDVYSNDINKLLGFHKEIVNDNFEMVRQDTVSCQEFLDILTSGEFISLTEKTYPEYQSSNSPLSVFGIFYEFPFKVQAKMNIEKVSHEPDNFVYCLKDKMLVCTSCHSKTQEDLDIKLHTCSCGNKMTKNNVYSYRGKSNSFNELNIEDGEYSILELSFKRKKNGIISKIDLTTTTIDIKDENNKKYTVKYKDDYFNIENIVDKVKDLNKVNFIDEEQFQIIINNGLLEKHIEFIQELCLRADIKVKDKLEFIVTDIDKYLDFIKNNNFKYFKCFRNFDNNHKLSKKIDVVSLIDYSLEYGNQAVYDSMYVEHVNYDFCALKNIDIQFDFVNSPLNLTALNIKGIECINSMYKIKDDKEFLLSIKDFILFAKDAHPDNKGKMNEHNPFNIYHIDCMVEIFDELKNQQMDEEQQYYLIKLITNYHKYNTLYYSGENITKYNFKLIWNQYCKVLNNKVYETYMKSIVVDDNHQRDISIKNLFDFLTELIEDENYLQNLIVNQLKDIQNVNQYFDVSTLNFNFLSENEITSSILLRIIDDLDRTNTYWYRPGDTLEKVKCLYKFQEKQYLFNFNPKQKVMFNVLHHMDCRNYSFHQSYINMILDLDELGLDADLFISNLVLNPNEQIMRFALDTLYAYKQVKHLIPGRKFNYNDIDSEHDFLTGLSVLNRNQDMDFYQLYNIDKKIELNEKEFFIISPKNTLDLIVEGTSLNHCVGSYSDIISNRQECVLFFRHQPNKSLYTFSVSNKGEIIEMSGKNNTKAPIDLINDLEELINQDEELMKEINNFYKKEE